MKTKNFKTKISLVCGSDDLRPAFMHLYFKDGYVYATNAHIALKQGLIDHDFTSDEIEILNGKLLHKAAFNEIYRYDNVTVQNDGFLCTKGHITALISFTPANELKYPDIDSILPSGALVPVDSIGVNSKLLNLLHSVTLSDTKHHKTQFYGQNKAVLFTPTDKSISETILIMPVMAND